jgi:N-methylhydantoinase B
VLRLGVDAAPAEVLGDVRRGLVSDEAAERDYGVVIRDDMVDEQANAGLRAAQRSERGAPPQFDLGELPEGVSVG